MKRALLSLVSLALVWGAEAQEWEDAAVPGTWNGSTEKWFRCWVKVPDHWTVMTGRSLWRESVTFTVTDVAGVHEVYINGQRIGGAGTFPPGSESPRRRG